MAERDAGTHENSTSLRWARLVYVAIATTLLIGYFATPSLRLMIVPASALAGVIAIGVGVAAFRPQRRIAWILTAMAIGLLGIGVLAFGVHNELTGMRLINPGVSISLYVSTFGPLTLGLLLLGGPREPSWEWLPVLDIVAVSLAGALVGWIILRSGATTTPTTAAGKVAAVAGWVGCTAVLAALVRVLVSRRTNRAMVLLAVAVAAFLIAALFYDKELINGANSVGIAAGLGFLSFNILCGAAALTASAGVVATAGSARRGLAPTRLVLLGLAMLVAPTVLLVEAVSGLVTTGVAIAAVSAEIGLVVMFRLYLLAQAHRRRARRVEVVRRASKAFAIANTDEETIDAARAALLEMLAPGAAGDVRLMTSLPQDASASAGLSRSVADSPDAIGELTIPSTANAGHRQSDSCAPLAADRPRLAALVYTAPTAQLIELSPVLQLLADEAALALHRIRLSNDLRAEERERYFRTLVLTSDDVTLISRDGVIVYATPSALAMFGRTVTGERFDQLVKPESDDPHPQHGWWTVASQAEGHLTRDGQRVTVLIRSRDLSRDPTVAGMVTTLRDVTVERRLQSDLIWRATHDPLTGLANAQHFSEQLQDSGRRSPNRRGPAGPGTAALYIDLDDFKAVNDTHGHHTGDRLLNATARRVQSCLRANDLAARLGGDEFAVLLRDLADVHAARDVARRMTGVLSKPIAVDSLTLECRASIGMAYTETVRAGDSLLREADMALYAAKSQGKGLWIQYGQALNPGGWKR